MTRSIFRHFAVLLPLILPLPTYAIDIEELAAALAERGADSTAYEQTRYLGILDEPLESSGRLSFEPPDRLVQEQREPEARILTLDGEQLTFEADGRRRVVQLEDSPEGAALADSLRGILNGRIDVLSEDYELVLNERPDDGWRLHLLPLRGELADRIRRIEVIGQIDAGLAIVERLTLEFANGDRSVMRLDQHREDEPDHEPASP
ncbi:outer membrane lipoprotein carrier protein LolA [Guyparkeria sp. SCN-R1]|uniref:outer membrane lipoprotein carrier protein LolA n=1 Tax=Guyparkeria sp. SCN-R1 TaxID=2341113 RepID=UPI000F646DDC|nr:outer membrane lipoprotein carrier protein LolA [Guyparkeria sp. SCN-R1]RRQ24012.1 outer membrane lipoprotein carrier protein LolA [Guyparkeria sp. SCN-R1]